MGGELMNKNTPRHKIDDQVIELKYPPIKK
jgi:hypothetical protein